MIEKAIKISKEDRDKLFFTSDTHYGHTNIIRMSNRPYNNVYEMNKGIVENFNEKVPEDGIVFHLGDFAFRSKSDELKWVIENLNGTINLVKGNHEKDVMSKAWARDRFNMIDKAFELDVEEDDGTWQKINLFHYSQRSWNGAFRGAWHLFGHSHGNLDNEPWGLSFDVGVDSHNWYPLSYDEVKEIMNTKIANPR